jgi:hypothetical protein
MKGLELLEKHPLTANVVRDWFMNQMLESFKDETVPEGFKQYMLEQGIDNDKVGTLIDVNPRNLLDVFDENHILIEIFRPLNEGSIYPSNYFSYKIGNISPDIKKTRKEAELFAIDAAFEILEKQLTPKEETNENE